MNITDTVDKLHYLNGSRDFNLIPEAEQDILISVLMEREASANYMEYLIEHRLLEDLGDITRALLKGRNPEELFARANDVLVGMARDHYYPQAEEIYNSYIKAVGDEI